MKRTGPTAKTVMQVVMRDYGLCAVCGKGCHGERGRDWSVQHRLRRGSGGTVREFVNLPANLVLLHGSGTTGCHGRVENERAWAKEFGYRVPDGVLLPCEVPLLHHGHGGWVMLADDGTFEREPDSLPERAS